MNREFLDLYNRELELLNEQAREFAEEYPGVAERLGGLLADRMDPMIGGLLEGTAFLAARVQLKLKHEFAEFTSNLIEQLVPNYLAPTPSVILARVTPPYANPALREGISIPRGSYFDATYRERDRRIACRFQLTERLDLSPFEITGAVYHNAPGPLTALGLAPERDVFAGLRLTLTLRTAERAEDEPPDAAAHEKPALRLSGVKADSLRIQLMGSEPDAVAMYEQLFARCRGMFFRYLDGFGDPVVLRAPPEMLEQVGFAEEETLLPRDARVFHGFDVLRDYFILPRKCLGFRLTGLRAMLKRLPAKSVDILFTFDEVNARLASAVRPEMFALHTVPAVNLFEKTLDRIPVKTNQHEYHVVPDRSRMLDFEPHRILEVFAHIAGEAAKVPVRPLYSALPETLGSTPAFVYTVRRLPRRRSTAERRYGSPSDYVGTEMFLSLGGGPTGETGRAAELGVRALCSNRHLTAQLPVGHGGADFRFLDDVTLPIHCVAGPTPPREPVVSALRSRSETASTGEVAWRLVNMLSLNHLGLVERAGGANAEALREMLSLFADMSDGATDRRIRGIRQVDAKPVVRRLRQKNGVGVARGLEVTILLDDKAFEGSGAFLMGAVLDRFFSEYVAINHFTQAVIRTTERGEIMRWPPRAGRRGML